MTVSELEALLPPRVVSQSLQQGLKQVDETSDSVDYKGLEKVLKSQIYRQLQAKMPKEQAKDKIKDILALLEDSGKTPEAPVEPEVDPLEAQGKAISELKKPCALITCTLSGQKRKNCGRNCNCSKKPNKQVTKPHHF
jgi:hypothetical protein